ncbi:BrnT family toxin [Bradyrhizobium sp.]|uniref:BrnT family toxin n=1 Tax=Bradyrhizobium sp. TaxID=376 RepID=UPI00344C5D62
MDFADAAIIFAGPTISVQDTRQDYGEPRYQTVGFLARRMVMMVWTPRGTARHIISMRKCNEREKAKYQERFGQG